MALRLRHHDDAGRMRARARGDDSRARSSRRSSRPASRRSAPGAWPASPPISARCWRPALRPAGRCPHQAERTERPIADVIGLIGPREPDPGAAAARRPADGRHVAARRRGRIGRDIPKLTARSRQPGHLARATRRLIRDLKLGDELADLQDDDQDDSQDQENADGQSNETGDDQSDSSETARLRRAGRGDRGRVRAGRRLRDGGRPGADRDADGPGDEEEPGRAEPSVAAARRAPTSRWPAVSRLQR